MEITLKKEYTSPQGAKYKKGSKIDVSRQLYKIILEGEYCEPIEEKKAAKKKVKKVKKIENNGDIS